MFTLVTIEDVILVPPHFFGKPRLAALEHEVNKRFSDQVIPSFGLCVALWDWIDVGEDRLVLQTGESSTKCTFRLVVFKPFEGEVVFSRINAGHESGIFLELGFFDAVHVPKSLLPRPVEWDAKEKVWIWTYTGEGQDPVRLYMDVSNDCVFRVAECRFEDRATVHPVDRDEETKGAMWIGGALYDEVSEGNQGLGDPLWWDEGEEGEEEQGQEGAGEEETEEAIAQEEQGGADEAGAEGREGDDWDYDYAEEGDGDGELVAEAQFARPHGDG